MTRAATALTLTDRAESASSVLPPLLVEAERIAATMILGDHGRKRAGPGESFWQYRPYSFGDSTQRIDWHKSARSDRVFIRENEWEAANTLWLWTSSHPSMDFRSHLSTVSKRERAQLLTLAMGSLAVRAHERIGAIGSPDSPDHSRTSLIRIADWLLGTSAGTLPSFTRMPRFSSALLVSDFFDPIADITRAVTSLASAGMHGHLVQVLDPAEESLPYTGRIEFQEMAGPMKYLSAKTETLREAYGAKLENHREALRELSRRVGWTFSVHRTDEPPARHLMMLHALVSGAMGR
jgi:uncharacterized protein (DUF58 family)